MTLTVVLVVGFAVAILWHKRNAPTRSPQAAAFTTTFAAAFFLITGFIGFGLQKGPAFASAARWTGAVIWPQVILGIAFLVASIFCWRRAIRDAERRLALR